MNQIKNTSLESSYLLCVFFSDSQPNGPLIEVLKCLNSENRLKMQRNNLSNVFNIISLYKICYKLKLIIYKSSNIQYFCAASLL